MVNREIRPLLNCDSEGVPKVVQFVEYLSSGMWWRFTLFDGAQRVIAEENVPVQGMDILTYRVTPEQIQDAINWFEERWDDQNFRVAMGFTA